MKATIQSTEKIVKFNGVPARCWQGVTEGGVHFTAFVVRLMVNKDQDNSQFEKELQENAPPSVEIGAIPLRMLL